MATVPLPTLTVPTSSAWGNARSTALVATGLAVAALAGAAVMGEWPWLLGAAVLTPYMLYSLREAVEITRSPSQMTIDDKELLIPQRALGRWRKQRVVLAEVSTVMTGPTVLLFKANDRGGVEGLGAFPLSWFDWSSVEPATFVAALQPTA